MNSPIKKEIFTETGCIRQELLRQYCEGKINASGKYEVEKHLIDCKLCSDALEGMALISDYSIIDQVKSEIPSLLKGQSGTPPVRYLAAAASIAALVFVSYLAYRQFSDVKDERLATHNALPVPENMIAGEQEVQLQQNAFAGDSQQKALPENRITTVSPGQNNPLPSASVNKDMMPAKEEQPAVTATGNTESVLLSRDAEVEDAISHDAQSAPAASQVDEVTISSSGLKNRSSELSNITYISNLKVVDYSNEGAAKNAKPSPSSGTPSKYQNRAKKAEAEADEAKSGMVVERNVNYLQLLASPMEYYNLGKYEEAIRGFDEILNVNPTDQNARFYKGMSKYHLKEFNNAIELLRPTYTNPANTFSEEAGFYLAKSYLATGKKNLAMDLFHKIENAKGFYSRQAEMELKKLR